MADFVLALLQQKKSARQAKRDLGFGIYLYMRHTALVGWHGDQTLDYHGGDGKVDPDEPVNDLVGVVR